MRDIKNPKIIWVKGIVFLLMGIAASALLVMEAPTLRVAILLAVTIWAFCRAYYFAFYVIERYVDPSYRFSGLISFVAYTLRRRSGQ
ncbi:MAG TPA: hypothetical protein VK615_13875 [Candidatus Binatia bacterium]|nr:hypothetical protein [Candidatus Binatia bacterium]